MRKSTIAALIPLAASLAFASLGAFAAPGDQADVRIAKPGSKPPVDGTKPPVKEPTLGDQLLGTLHPDGPKPPKDPSKGDGPKGNGPKDIAGKVDDLIKGDAGKGGKGDDGPKGKPDLIKPGGKDEPGKIDFPNKPQKPDDSKLVSLPNPGAAKPEPPLMPDTKPMIPIKPVEPVAVKPPVQIDPVRPMPLPIINVTPVKPILAPIDTPKPVALTPSVSAPKPPAMPMTVTK